jgi:hypothetical protein
MSDLDISNRKELLEAKKTLKKRMDRREILIRTNMAYFQDRWQDERTGGTFPYKNIIMDGVSVLVDAVYVLKDGTRNKTRLLIRFTEVAVHYVSERYMGGAIRLIKQLIPFVKEGAKKTAEKDQEEADS